MKTSHHPTTYLTYADLARDVQLLASKLPPNIVGVVGVPRSGMIAAGMLAELLHIPLADSGTFRRGWWLGHGERMAGVAEPKSGNVVVLDDSAHHGKAIKQAVARLTRCATLRQYNLIPAVVYRNPVLTRSDLIYARDILLPRYFQRNLKQHPDIKNWVSDIDGVLCWDSTVYDDDGPEYVKSLENATPLHLPKRKVHTLVTMRIGKWRAVTESWLRRHGVECGLLVMPDCESARERRATIASYGRWKGEIYGRSECSLFVESAAEQAKEIAKVSGKPVVCLEDHRVYQ